jgi:hypothetical protein
VLLVLVGLGALWASIANDPAGDGTATGTTSASSSAEEEPSASEEPSGDGGSAENSAAETTSESTESETSDAGDGDTTLDADNVDDLLADYHELVFDDPAAAYEQAGPTLRSSISLENFEDFWNDFTDVAISDVEVEDGGESALAVMEFDYPDGTTQVERHRFTFIEEGDRLVLDSDRFVELLQDRG